MNMSFTTLITRMGCHRLSDRSFIFQGKPMPFCARCFGASAGHVFSFILFCMGLLPPLGLCVFFMFIIFLDWSFQKWFGIMSTRVNAFFS